MAEVVRIRDYERKAPPPRDRSESADVVFLPMIRIERWATRFMALSDDSFVFKGSPK